MKSGSKLKNERKNKDLNVFVVVKAHKDHLLTAKGAEDGKEHVYGIKIEKSNAFQGATILEPLVISLINPPKNMEKALEVVNYLLQ